MQRHELAETRGWSVVLPVWEEEGRRGITVRLLLFERRWMSKRLSLNLDAGFNGVSDACFPCLNAACSK
jgi:hypothetical protein